MDQDNEIFSIAILAFMVFFIFTCFCKVKSDVENFVGGGSYDEDEESDLEQHGGRRRGGRGQGSGGQGSRGRGSGGRTDRLARRARSHNRRRLYRPRYYGNTSWLWNNYYPYYGNYFNLYNPWRQVNTACANIAARKCQGQYYYEPCFDSQHKECVFDQNNSKNWYSMWFA